MDLIFYFLSFYQHSCFLWPDPKVRQSSPGIISNIVTMVMYCNVVTMVMYCNVVTIVMPWKIWCPLGWQRCVPSVVVWLHWSRGRACHWCQDSSGEHTQCHACGWSCDYHMWLIHAHVTCRNPLLNLTTTSPSSNRIPASDARGGREEDREEGKEERRSQISGCCSVVSAH